MEKKRNLWVIPTDKPSRLLYNFTLKSFCIQTEKDGMFINDGNVAGADFWSIEKANNNGFRYINICITNSEEIKEGDWYLVELFNIEGKSKGLHIEKCTKLDDVWCNNFDAISTRHKNNCKKIILTTDQDLIKDGVQAVEEDFLNWFVKNPSCEEVEVEHIKVDDARPSGYKIIIPKEEPKQETLVRDYSNRSCKTCSLFNANNSGEGVCELELESECASYSNDETLEDFWISCLDDESDSVLYKQETLEEVAERLYPNGCDGTDRSAQIYRRIFIEGAKWQQEQNKNLYSEEQMDDAYDKGFNDAIDKQWLDKFKNK